MNLQINGADIDATAVSASVKSDWFELGDAEHGNYSWDGYSINLSWTGSGVGTFGLEVANAKSDALAVPLTQTIETTDASPSMFVVQGARYRLVRLTYLKISGTINLTALVVRK